VRAQNSAAAKEARPAVETFDDTDDDYDGETIADDMSRLSMRDNESVGYRSVTGRRSVRFDPHALAISNNKKPMADKVVWCPLTIVDQWTDEHLRYRISVALELPTDGLKRLSVRVSTDQRNLVIINTIHNHAMSPEEAFIHYHLKCVKDPAEKNPTETEAALPSKDYCKTTYNCTDERKGPFQD